MHSLQAGARRADDGYHSFLPHLYPLPQAGEEELIFQIKILFEINRPIIHRVFHLLGSESIVKNPDIVDLAIKKP